MGCQSPLATAEFPDVFASAGLAEPASPLPEDVFSPAAGFSPAFAPSTDGFDPGSSRPARLRFFSLSDLKSVSYQPLPDSRKAGAVTCRRTRCLPQLGQVSGSGSESFCRRSNCSPQSSQRKT